MVKLKWKNVLNGKIINDDFLIATGSVSSVRSIVVVVVVGNCWCSRLHPGKQAWHWLKWCLCWCWPAELEGGLFSSFGLIFLPQLGCAGGYSAFGWSGVLGWWNILPITSWVCPWPLLHLGVSLGRGLVEQWNYLLSFSGTPTILRLRGTYELFVFSWRSALLCLVYSMYFTKGCQSGFSLTLKNSSLNRFRGLYLHTLWHHNSVVL